MNANIGSILDRARRFSLPDWYVYLVASVYVCFSAGWAVYRGPFVAEPVSLVLGSYAAYPTSMVLFSVFMCLSLKSWRWKAIPLTVFAALEYDATFSLNGGWIYGNKVVLAVYLVFPLVFWLVNRPKVRANWYMCAYWAALFIYTGWAGTAGWGNFNPPPVLVNAFLVSNTAEALLIESFFEVLWCVAVARTFRP